MALAPHLFGIDTERSTADNPWGLEPLLDVNELAGYLGIPVSTVYDWRTRSLGPPAYRFPDLVTYWLEDLDLEDRLSKRTRQLYERNMQTLVMPVFRNLTLREIGVARCDHFLKQLAKQSYNRAKQARVALRLALGLAVRHEVLPRNPMDHVARLHRPASTPNALTPSEVNAIRVAIAFWEAGRSPSGPKPDGQLGAIVEVMLCCSVAERELR